jgi:hypothetical protein
MLKLFCDSTILELNVYLFTCSLFNDAFTNLDYIVSNVWVVMHNEFGKDKDGSSPRLIGGTILPFLGGGGGGGGTNETKKKPQLIKM